MNTKTISYILLATLVLVGTASASELSDYHALVNQASNQGYSSQKLDDMAYQYGGIGNLVARMNALEAAPVYIVNSYAKYNPLTGNIEYTGRYVIEMP